MRSKTILVACFVLSSAGCWAPRDEAAPVLSALEAQQTPRDQAGWDALVSWDALPTLSQGSVHSFSSTERENSGVWFPYDAGNKDFNNFLAVCGDRPALIYQYVDNTVACGDGEEGYLLAAVDGAGYISRMGFGGASPDLTAQTDSGLPIQAHPTDELLKFYIDDAKEPAYVGRWSDWDKGVAAPFTTPLTGWSSGFILNYVPISFQHRLRVFADALNPTLYTYYYQVTVHNVSSTETFDPAVLQSSEAQTELTAVTDLATRLHNTDSWLDNQVSLDGEAPQTVWERAGSGTIEQIEVELDAARAQQALAQIKLRVFWDDETDPALDQTLADLFGARLSRQSAPDYQTLPMSIQHTESTLRLRVTLPMPFASAARVVLARTLAAGSEQLHVRILGRNTVPDGAWGHLRTLQTTRTQPNLGERFVVADLRGPGKYIGTLLYMAGGPNDQNLIPGPMPLNFLEGDDHIEIDGNISQGTGTEETFNGGWYFSDGRFQSPFAALLHIEQTDPEHGEISAIRWNILSDSLPFQTHFKLSYEYGADNPQTAEEYTSIAFYYARSSVGLSTVRDE